MDRTTARSVADLVARLETAYPPETAEDWDRVGLAVGDPQATVRRVLLTVDVTDAVIAEAVDQDVQLIVSHHPLLLRGIHQVRVDEPKGRLLTALLRTGIALYTAHTNADIAVDGTAAALAETLGLIDPVPLVPVPVRRLDKIVTFVPQDQLAAVVDALAAAGAGALGDYDRCTFTSSGVGTFRPLPGADPFLGTIGTTAQVAETRLEMVMERGRRAGVLAALLAAHPYQTPAYDVLELAEGNSITGLGRVGAISPCTVGELAARAGDVLGCGPAEVRVAGDPDRLVRRLAVQAGAGDDLLEQARRSGADAYLTSDLRHHPAAEASAWDDAPALIDVPHAAAEALWLPRLRSLLTQPPGAGPAVEISAVRTDPFATT